MSNVNDIKSKVTKITLMDGVERTIRYDLNAMAELEEKYGSVDAAFEELDKNSIKALRFVLWAGLVHEDEELTEKQVGSLIDLNSIKSIMQTLGDAFEADMPEEGKEQALIGNDNPNA